MTDQTQEKAAIPAEIQQKKKVPGRPFPKGVSGNPKGKPKGTKSFDTIFEEAVRKIAREGQLDVKDPMVAMVAKAIMRAVEGDYPYYRDLMDRQFGKTPTPLQIETYQPTPEEKEQANKALEDIE